MVKEKKAPKTDAPELQVQTEEVKEIPPGFRGEVGIASASQTLKQMWHEAHHVLQSVGNSKNPRKELWVKHKGAPSLKKFGRQLALAKDPVAMAWLSNKSGGLNEKRTDKNRARISLERQASSSARKKKSQKAPKATAAV